MSFHIVFKNLLTRKKIRQNRIAVLLNVTTSYVANLVNGKTPPPTFENCEKIASFLELNQTEKMEFLTEALKDRLGDNWKFIVACGFTDEASEGLMKVIRFQYTPLLENEDASNESSKQSLLDEEIKGFLKEFYELPVDKRIAFIKSIRGLLDGMK